MDIILASILSAVGGAIFAGLVLGMKRIKALGKLVKAVAHDALFARCEMLLERGYITTDELENLDMLWDAYTGLGLNGAGEELYKRCKSLPIK